MMKRRLVAALACRNQGSRLYGKPMQNLSVTDGVRIIDNVIGCLRTLACIDEIVLGISDGVENEVFKTVAAQHGLQYIVGDERDVLLRLIQCGDKGGATDIFRITTESPFLYYEPVAAVWEQHVAQDLDASFYDEGVDGTGFEIISMNALRVSHEKGNERHRSELCTLYLREHVKDFKIQKIIAPEWLNRKDLRLTVDNPEDLALCRHIYQAFAEDAPRFSVERIVSYLDQHPELKKMVMPYTEAGYSTMNL